MSFSSSTYLGDDSNENLGPQINAVAVAFIALTFVTLILRLISRLRTKVSIEADDWLILIAAILSWSFDIAAIVEVQRNFTGQHIGKFDEYHLKEFGKTSYCMILLYTPALTFSKLSLLALYWRIFRVTSARLPLQILAALNIAYMLATSLVTIFNCVPIQGFWNLTIKRRCLNDPVLFVTTECFTTALDLAILLMPVYSIAHLQRSLSQKVSILSTFLLGLIGTVVSCVRLWQLVLDQRKPGFDPTFNHVPATLWGIVELNVWIIVASIPSLRPLVMKTIRDYKEWRCQSRTKSHPSGSFNVLKGRVWPSKGVLSTRTHGRGHLALNRSEAGAVEQPFSYVPVHGYNCEVSAGSPIREPERTLLAISNDDQGQPGASHLQDSRKIQIDREFTVSHSENIM